jgi:hypothetical protein
MVTGTGKKQEPEADKYKTVICKEEHAIIPDEAVDYPTDFIPSCLNDLPEPYRSEAIAAFKAEGNPSKYKAKYISGAFIWHASIQGLDYWVLVKQAINQNENLFNPDGSPRFTPEMFGGKSALKQADHA